MTACLDVLALFEKKILRIVDYRLALSADIWYNAVNKKMHRPRLPVVAMLRATVTAAGFARR